MQAVTNAYSLSTAENPRITPEIRERIGKEASSITRSLGLARSESEEVASDLTVSWLGECSNYDPARGTRGQHLSVFLKSRGANQRRDRYRMTKQFVALSTGHLCARATNPDLPDLDVDFVEFMEDVPEASRDIAMRAYLGQSIADMARELDLPDSTVRSRFKSLRPCARRYLVRCDLEKL